MKWDCVTWNRFTPLHVPFHHDFTTREWPLVIYDYIGSRCQSSHRYGVLPNLLVCICFPHYPGLDATAIANAYAVADTSKKFVNRDTTTMPPINTPHRCRFHRQSNLDKLQRCWIAISAIIAAVNGNSNHQGVAHVRIRWLILLHWSGCRIVRAAIVHCHYQKFVEFSETNMANLVLWN